MPATKELFQKYQNPILIESGSYNGDGIQSGLESGFEKIYSIELSEKYFNVCIERFKINKNVILIFGDSSEKMSELLNTIKEPVTFWLDGHYSGEDTARGSQDTPLIQELEIINNHHIKTHKILIDDLRGWDHNTHGFDTLDLMKLILIINPDYKFTLEDGYIKHDILTAIC